MKHAFTMGGYPAEYDLTTLVFTRWEMDGVAVADTRAMTDDERQFFTGTSLPSLVEQVQSLTSAVDQLILDNLMGPPA